MADIKISALPQVTSLTTSDLLPAVYLGSTSKITFGDFSAAIPGVTSSISASYSSNSSTASFSQTASYALTASYSLTSVFPYTGSAAITGSLQVTGSVTVQSGSLIVNDIVLIGANNTVSNNNYYKNVLAVGINNVIGSQYADRKSTRLNSSHVSESRMPSSA